MEEEIKILKNLIEYLQFKIDSGEHKIIYNDLMYDEKTIDCINSIENLIKAYKELEEKWDKDTHTLQNALDLANADKINNYIPVSLVKEKIEEINKAYEDSKDENGESQYYYPDYTIRVLEELLEKRK